MGCRNIVFDITDFATNSKRLLRFVDKKIDIENQWLVTNITWKTAVNFLSLVFAIHRHENSIRFLCSFICYWNQLTDVFKGETSSVVEFWYAVTNFVISYNTGLRILMIACSRTGKTLNLQAIFCNIFLKMEPSFFQLPKQK